MPKLLFTQTEPIEVCIYGMKQLNIITVCYIEMCLTMMEWIFGINKEHTAWIYNSLSGILRAQQFTRIQPSSGIWSLCVSIYNWNTADYRIYPSSNIEPNRTVQTVASINIYSYPLLYWVHNFGLYTKQHTAKQPKFSCFFLHKRLFSIRFHRHILETGSIHRNPFRAVMGKCAFIRQYWVSLTEYAQRSGSSQRQFFILSRNSVRFLSFVIRFFRTIKNDGGWLKKQW